MGDIDLKKDAAFAKSEAGTPASAEGGMRGEKEPKDDRFDDVDGGGDDDSDDDKEGEDDDAGDKVIEKDEKSKDKLDKKKKKISERIKAFFANPKKRLIFIIIMGLILIGLVGGGVYIMNHDGSAGVSSTATENTGTTSPVPQYPAVLDGVMTDQNSSSRHPVAVMVENHPDARPQAGLDKASVIYEAIAEGGITRFLAVYGTYESEKVGPVRSARTYYVDWAHGFDAFYAHVGGNMDALQKIPKDKVYDLDQFKYSAPYWRILSSGLVSEHTMYTSTLKLRDQASKNKYPTANNFNVYKYKDDPLLVDRPEAQTVTVDFSTAPYKVDFVYDKTTDSYKRNLAGKAHTDQITKEGLNPKNIVIMSMSRRTTVTSINEQGYIMDTVGSGKARFFFDGKETSGTWKKDSAGSREMFYDTNGVEITFDRGQLWICVISAESKVTVQ